MNPNLLLPHLPRDSNNILLRDIFKVPLLLLLLLRLLLLLLLLFLLLLQSALQALVGFRPAQLPLSILSRKVLQSVVASGTSIPQLGGEIFLGLGD
jgi:uncharacterized membrane protein